MKVDAFTRYARRAASTRQRLLQYVPLLRDAGIEVEHHALLDDDYVQGLATGEPFPKRKIAGAYLDRWHQLNACRSSEILWIYVELFPYLPAWIEELATRGRTIVYDMDDAFFHRYDDADNILVRGLLAGKHARLLSGAAASACGNEYLREFAGPHCANSIVLPTVVDTNVYRPVRTTTEGPVVIGWIGSPTTWPNVRPLLPLLRELCSDLCVIVRVIGAGAEAERDRFPGLELVEWSEAAEVSLVQHMDIGIMPLADSEFERGKSGYKLIQYMACGLPAVASPVGVNRSLVDDGVNGFLATTDAEWREALIRLIAGPQLRQRMGRRGRDLVERSYSLESQGPRLVELLNSVAERSRS
jgi:glycosyltransferase involved in cell wall biosynthesis